ncbi:1,2-phenylacetyl-CoA epoxidase subunit PaaC [Xenorhabdus nematophila]|uniref:Subunit of multicomponent oxygenase, phenylacetic acid degradation n=1 Tax=Xenorhabdus nematophila (strain ATCC 19061 / DSM 3370 / CCUG 14189 / LMG 1036 / NCIMB 9965 / AN6) TaxID=406817 RepID=D3VFX4_XENNA|nr:1,2-phenylacetyl-CoA epoxidase subunit PaaC [Xenorhabdus nematophila]CBJ92640.1 putative subunit of multicomponent oxygenase, phenylacetic acid degradation [Xenorhabdus nematophila ATCC 19061]CCW32776.1 Phenylacetic acid degradation protein paaC [Xenorhabdus nematophila F1]CEE94278.1 putative subunit of multicomponent oxygenase, phenylacetic acid degradation [Xenorhabdus nematophila str. Anatoliense]CEK25447.1 putative subunit of multicomponent oxygenase, phenylacetic acid degradation [Xenor
MSTHSVSSFNHDLFHYVLRQGDTPLILAQRLCEWCGHAPELEIDLALSNIGLDLLGQARHFLSYAATLSGTGFGEDQLAFGRDEREFLNLLLVEQPNGGFNDTLVRQFFIDTYHVLLHQALGQSCDPQLAAISNKALKEVEYHLRFSRGWMIRLGDGTKQSHQKIQHAVDQLWRFTGELFHCDEIEQRLAEEGIAVDPRTLHEPWLQIINDTFTEATLDIPPESPYRQGGKQGLHTEHLGYILAEMQYLQRTYPNCDW